MKNKIFFLFCIAVFICSADIIYAQTNMNIKLIPYAMRRGQMSGLVEKIGKEPNRSRKQELSNQLADLISEALEKKDTDTLTKVSDQMILILTEEGVKQAGPYFGIFYNALTDIANADINKEMIVETYKQIYRYPAVRSMTKEVIIHSLMRINDEKILPFLTSVYESDSTASIRTSIVHALSRKVTKGAIDVDNDYFINILTMASQDLNIETKKNVLLLLEKIIDKSEAARKLLRNMTEDRNSSIQEMAGTLLGEAGPVMNSKLRYLLEEFNRVIDDNSVYKLELHSKIEKVFTKHDIPFLIKVLEDENYKDATKTWLIPLLGKFPGDIYDAVPVLIKALDNKDNYREMRNNAAYVFCQIQDRRCVDKLLEIVGQHIDMFATRPPEVNIKTVKDYEITHGSAKGNLELALINNAEVRIIPDLVEMLSSPYPDVRISAIKVLPAIAEKERVFDLKTGELGLSEDLDITSRLVGMLYDEDVNVVSHALDALVRLKEHIRDDINLILKDILKKTDDPVLRKIIKRKRGYFMNVPFRNKDKEKLPVEQYARNKDVLQDLKEIINKDVLEEVKDYLSRDAAGVGDGVEIDTVDLVQDNIVIKGFCLKQEDVHIFVENIPDTTVNFEELEEGARGAFTITTPLFPDFYAAIQHIIEKYNAE